MKLRWPCILSAACCVGTSLLAADPRATNRERMDVQVESLDLSATALADGTLRVDATSGGVAEGLPPGSILLYAIDAKP